MSLKLIFGFGSHIMQIMYDPKVDSDIVYIDSVIPTEEDACGLCFVKCDLIVEHSLPKMLKIKQQN